MGWKILLITDFEKANIIKGNPFPFVCKIIDEDGKAITNRRVSLVFELRRSTAREIPPLDFLEVMKENDFANKITDGEGLLTTTIKIKEVSRKADSEGLILIIGFSDGLGSICTSPTFRVTSKRKRLNDSEEKATKKELCTKIKSLNEEVQELNKRIVSLENKLDSLCSKNNIIL